MHKESICMCNKNPTHLFTPLVNTPSSACLLLHVTACNFRVTALSRLKLGAVRSVQWIHYHNKTVESVFLNQKLFHTKKKEIKLSRNINVLRRGWMQCFAGLDRVHCSVLNVGCISVRVQRNVTLTLWFNSLKADSEAFFNIASFFESLKELESMDSKFLCKILKH